MIYTFQAKDLLQASKKGSCLQLLKKYSNHFAPNFVSELFQLDFIVRFDTVKSTYKKIFAGQPN